MEKTTAEANCWDLGLSGLDRYLNNPPDKKGIHIATDPAFQQSYQMLDTKLKDMKKHGEQNVKHKPVPLSVKTCSVWKKAPLSLLYNVWFHVNLYFNWFCRRGQEGQRNLMKSSFLSLKDENSEWYATRNHGPWRDKQNTPREDTATNYEKLGRMYRRARWKKSAKRLVYTNHCLRATAITLWSDAGLSMTLSWSGHRSSSSRCVATSSHLPWIHKPDKPIRKCKSSVGTSSNLDNLDPLLQTSKTSQSNMSDSNSQPSSRAAKSDKFTLFSRAIKHSGIHLEVLSLENRNSLNISSVFTKL